MTNVKWIKLATDIFDNRKIKLIERMPDGDSLIVIWLKLLCLAGTVNDSGLVYLTREVPYTDEMLAATFDRPLTTVRLALQTFERFDMIETVNDILLLPSWEKYQSADKLDKLRETSRVSSAKYREKQKVLTGDVTSDTDVTASDHTDKEKEEDKDNIGGKSKRFIPPTLEEVTAYCKERYNGVDPVAWWNFYNSKNWMVGKNKMTTWKSAIVTWERKNGLTPTPPPLTPAKPKKYREVSVNGEVMMEAVDE